MLALVGGGQLPSATLVPSELLAAGGLEVADAAVRCGAAKSKAEARRLVAARGLYLNQARVEDARARLGAGDFLGGRVALLSSGKKKSWALVLAAEGEGGGGAPVA